MPRTRSDASNRKAAAAASAVLSRDARMADLVAEHGQAPLGTRTLFVSALRAIVSQQLSVASARAIMQRIEARYALDADRMHRAQVATLRRLGLSDSKAGTVRRVAKMIVAGELEDLDELSDEGVIDRLTEIKGVGPWTAHMVMMFGLGRPNVWPVGDVGIQRAARLLYRVDGPDGLDRLGERFQPYRSYAAWYLWRSLG